LNLIRKLKSEKIFFKSWKQLPSSKVSNRNFLTYLETWGRGVFLLKAGAKLGVQRKQWVFEDVDLSFKGNSEEEEKKDDDFLPEEPREEQNEESDSENNEEGENKTG
jgi:hypothetical protein